MKRILLIAAAVLIFSGVSIAEAGGPAVKGCKGGGCGMHYGLFSGFHHPGAAGGAHGGWSGYDHDHGHGYRHWMIHGYPYGPPWAHRSPWGLTPQTYGPGPLSATVTYPYYTLRGPRDFLMDNPPSIGN